MTNSRDREKGIEAFPNVRGGIRGGYPTADQWLDIFRRAQMPLWLLDVTQVKAALEEAMDANGGDLCDWLGSHPEFLPRAVGLIRILEMSDMAVELSGAKDRKEFERRVDRFVVPEALPSIKEMLLALADGRSYRNGEAVYRTLDGRMVHTWNQVTLLKSQEGSDLVLLAMTDISRLKRTQRDLEGSEQKYRTLVETARDIILCNDLEGRITFVNQAGLDLLGWSREKIIGMPAVNLVPESLHGEMQKRAEKRTSGESGVFLYETRYMTAAGKELPVEVSSTLIRSPLDGDGMGQVLVVARDIADRKRQEEERRRFEARLRNAQKLESLGVLAGGIAHDFNNFLVAIMGSAELVKLDVSGGSESEHHLDLILEAAGSIADLCRQMQVYATAESPARATADLSEMVRSVSRLLDVSVAGRAQITLELEAGLPRVKVDESQIVQVLINVVGNAVEALGDEGGVVAIRTGVRALNDEDLARLVGSVSPAPGRYVFCEVRDSGCGMDEATAVRLFEPFFTTKFVGRGVGLFAAQGIVQSHGGGFLMDTHPGQGTSMTFLLPAQPERLPQSRTRQDHRADDSVFDPTGRTVMVVEDQPQVRKVAESFLRRLGCRVLVAANGFDAIRIFGQRYQDVDLVLLDLAMEGMDGVATGRRMRTILPGVPIVLTSGFSEAEVRRRAEALDPFDVLSKPFVQHQLRAVLERNLG